MTLTSNLFKSTTIKGNLSNVDDTVNNITASANIQRDLTIGNELILSKSNTYLTGDTSKTTYNLAIGNTLINSWLVITYATATNPTSLLTSLRFRLANLSNVYVAVNNNCVLSYLNYVPSIQMEILNNMFSAVCDGNQLLNNVVLVPLNESI